MKSKTPSRNMVGSKQRSYIKIYKDFYALYLNQRFIGRTNKLGIALEWII